MLTSMTNCEKMEGPTTTVKGSITDYSTKQGYGNITLQIARITRNLGGGLHYTAFDTVVTNAEGNYEVTFIPKGSGVFSIDYKDSDYRKNYYSTVDSGSKDLILGNTNIVNFKTRKLVNLQVKLKNNSLEIRNGWSLYVESSGLVRFISLNPLTKDTVFFLKASRLENATLVSTLYDEGVIRSEMKVKNQISIGEKDTVVQMIHK